MYFTNIKNKNKNMAHFRQFEQWSLIVFIVLYRLTYNKSFFCNTKCHLYKRNVM